MTEDVRRCPQDGRPLERTDRWLCPRCLHTYPDHPSLLGAPRRPTVPDPVGGRAVNLKLGEARLAWLDAHAAARGMSRAKAARVLLDIALGLSGTDFPDLDPNPATMSPETSPVAKGA